MKNFYLIISLSFLVCGFFSSCSDEKNEANIKSDMIVKMAFPQLFIEGNEGKEIIPYTSLYPQSEDEAIAMVDGFYIVGKSLGNTVIDIYRDEKKSELIKKINVEIIPTATLTLTCGYRATFQDIPSIGETGKTYYASNFKTSDTGVAILEDGNLMTFYIEALMPGTAYISDTHTYDGDVIVEVNVEKYNGSAPFPIPDNLVYFMDVNEVKSVMEGYNLKEEGGSALFNSKYATTLVYAPFGNAESITLYIGEGLSLATQNQKDKLLGFKIVPTSDTQDVVSYLLSNYTLNMDSWVDSSIWSGFRTFDSSSGWIIGSGADNWSEAWSSVDFYEN